MKESLLRDLLGSNLIKLVNSGLQEPIDSVFRHDSPFFDASIVQQFNNKAKAQDLINQWSAANGGAKLKFTMTVFTSTNYQLSAQYVPDWAAVARARSGTPAARSAAV